MRRPPQISEAELAANWRRTFQGDFPPAEPPPPSEEVGDGLWVWQADARATADWLMGPGGSDY